jgi:uncharacterized Zn ribbon protein
MNGTVTCPNPECTSENAFFNGVCYECPDCDHEWSEDANDEEE